MELPQKFTEEIDFSEIELDKVVGKGSFGLVKKGVWRNKDVAVKIIETEEEKRAFFIEVRQLSRVDHENIVKLYGACTKSPTVCLVMEYAEGGSLYNVLHCSPRIHYTAAHAISWVYQCAKGVAYLHSMKPKAVIHRDLKPPNLLLIMGGTMLKICDFGIACDKQTVMTNNKGSAAWMAPEVFEGNNYSETCDVFSWGIILWEVLTRRKPFDEVGGPAFRIMWAVYSGLRPPLVEGCPKPLERLMTRCWSKEAKARPSMFEVEEHLSHLFEYFKEGSDVPIIDPSLDDYGTVNDETLGSWTGSSHSEQESNTPQPSSTESTRENYPEHHSSTPTVVCTRPSRTSAPASLSSSQENLEESARFKRQTIIDPTKRKSADFTGIKSLHISTHRRTGSYGSPTIVEPVNSAHEHLNTNINNHNVPQQLQTSREPIHTEEIPGIHRTESWPNSIGSAYGNDNNLDWNAYVLLEPKLQPLPPDASSKESMEIYEAHRRAANEYLHVQTEIRLLTQRKKELEEELTEDQQKTSTYIEDYLQLRSEKDSLLKLRQNLKRQIEVIKNERQNRQRSASSNGEDWVVV